MIQIEELQPDLLVTGGTVITCSDRLPTATAVAVKRDRVLWVGPEERAQELAGPRTRRLMLNDHTLVPGFVDSHNHMLKAGLDLRKVQLGGLKAVAEVLQTIEGRARSLPDGEWIVAAASWHEAGLAEKRFPSRDELDAVGPKHPVYIPRGGHTAVVNSLALQLAGIDERAPDPPGGAFLRDPDRGRLTGQLFETSAMNLVSRLIPAPTFQDKVDALRQVMALFNRAGITAVRDPGLVKEPGLDAEDFRTYLALRRERKLTLRVSGMAGLPSGADPAVALAGLERQLVASDFGDSWLRVGAIKLIEAFEAVNKEARLQDQRWAIEHAILADHAQSRRLRDMGVWITAQPLHLYTLGQNMLKHWGAQRAHAAYPIRSWLDLGLRVAGGTDANVCPHEQILSLHVDVTRETEHAGLLGPEEAISVEAALRAHTRESADLLGTAEMGRIEAGALADFVVLIHNPLTTPPTDFKRIRVRLTMVGGETVHSDGSLTLQ
ncbi:MAG: amidohydrolase [Candidatus Rokubacteria bacterium]|nr:amidohydrolase [Candidatus Rokubacteria bacterium]